MKGDTCDCYRLARAAATKSGWVNASTTFSNPYAVEAYATLAFELATLRPDIVVLPTSCGPLPVGVMKGFAQLARLGVIERVPRPIAAQPLGCAPIVRAFECGEPVRRWAQAESVASALNDTLADYERDGDYTIEWLRRFDGTAVAVSDQEILAAAKALGCLEGIFVEPSAAVSVAASHKLLACGRLLSQDKIVAVTTGHVQVFGRRDDERRLALRRPASKKRQGTKSREVWRRLGGERYGDLILAPAMMVGAKLARGDLDGCGGGTWKRAMGSLGGRVDRINGRSAR